MKKNRLRPFAKGSASPFWVPRLCPLPSILEGSVHFLSIPLPWPSPSSNVPDKLPPRRSQLVPILIFWPFSISSHQVLCLLHQMDKHQGRGRENPVLNMLWSLPFATPTLGVHKQQWFCDHSREMLPSQISCSHKVKVTQSPTRLLSMGFSRQEYWSG